MAASKDEGVFLTISPFFSFSEQITFFIWISRPVSDVTASIQTDSLAPIAHLHFINWLDVARIQFRIKSNLNGRCQQIDPFNFILIFFPVGGAKAQKESWVGAFLPSSAVSGPPEKVASTVRRIAAGRGNRLLETSYTVITVAAH